MEHVAGVHASAAALRFIIVAGILANHHRLSAGTDDGDWQETIANNDAKWRCHRSTANIDADQSHFVDGT